MTVEIFCLTLKFSEFACRILVFLVIDVQFSAGLPWGRNFYPHTHGDPHRDPHIHGRPGFLWNFFQSDARCAISRLFAFTLYRFAVHVSEWDGSGNITVGISWEWE